MKKQTYSWMHAHKRLLNIAGELASSPSESSHASSKNADHNCTKLRQRPGPMHLLGANNRRVTEA